MASTPLETYHWLIQQGGKPLDVKFRGKNALHKDWQDPNYIPNIKTFTTSEVNIGARLGPGNFGGDIYDVDVDCKEALFYAARLLPTTQAIYGRPTNPRSHYLYRIVNAKETGRGQISDPTIKEGKRSIIDLRGRGGQTVLPGSVHESGELVEWVGDAYPTITIVEEDELIRAVRKVGMCVMLERHVWLPGMRHFANLSVTGMLYNMGFELQEVEDMLTLVMERHGDEDASRIPTLRGTWQKAENGERVTGATRLKADFPDAVPCINLWMKWFGSEIHSVIEEYNDQFAVVRYGGDIRIVINNDDGSFDLMNESAFHKLYMTDTISIKDKEGEEKKLPKSRLWFASPMRRQYKGLKFMPGVRPDDPKLMGMMNLWTGWGAEPADCTWSEAFRGCRGWLELLRTGICKGDEELFHWCRDWFASMLRDPMSKPGTSLTIRGPQGAGKSTIFGYFGQILGRGYVPVNSERGVTGNFNAHLEQCLLLHSEEAFYARSKQSQSVIKNLITDRQIQIERKGHDSLTIDNYSRIGATSNQLHVIHAEHDDRRNTFIDMEDHVPPQELFDRVYAEMEADGPAMLHRYLLEYEGYNPLRIRRPVETTHTSMQKILSADPLVRWWEERLQEGVLLNSPYGWCSKPANAAWPKKPSKRAIYCSFHKWCKDKGIPYIDGYQEFIEAKFPAMLANSPLLHGMERPGMRVPDDWLDKSRGIGDDLGDRQYTYKEFPDLATSRKFFQEYFKMKDYKWNDATPEPLERVHSSRNMDEATPNF